MFLQDGVAKCVEIDGQKVVSFADAGGGATDTSCCSAPDNADTASDTNLDTRLTAGHCTYFRTIEKICVCLLFMNNPWLMAWQRHLIFFDLSEGHVRKITELGQVNF